MFSIIRQERNYVYAIFDLRPRLSKIRARFLMLFFLVTDAAEPDGPAAEKNYSEPRDTLYKIY